MIYKKLENYQKKKNASHPVESANVSLTVFKIEKFSVLTDMVVNHVCESEKKHRMA